jgi:hypothetical protein
MYTVGETTGVVINGASRMVSNVTLKLRMKRPAGAGTRLGAASSSLQSQKSETETQKSGGGVELKTSGGRAVLMSLRQETVPPATRGDDLNININANYNADADMDAVFDGQSESEHEDADDMRRVLSSLRVLQSAALQLPSSLASSSAASMRAPVSLASSSSSLTSSSSSFLSSEAEPSLSSSFSVGIQRLRASLADRFQHAQSVQRRLTSSSSSSSFSSPSPSSSHAYHTQASDPFLQGVGAVTTITIGIHVVSDETVDGQVVTECPSERF